MNKRILTTVIVLIVIAGLLLTAHLIVNQLNLADVIRTVHSG